MNNVSGHIAILAGAGLAAYALAALVHPGQRSETASSAQAPVVVTLPRRAGEAPRAPASEPPRATATPGDHASLARQLQIELKRVGCYGGEINGAWTSPTRAAMKTFTDRVNATLPIDKPDHILLALVQSHRQRVCGPAETRTPAIIAAPKLLSPPTLVTPPPPKIESSPRPPSARPDPVPEPPKAQLPAEPTPSSERPHRSAHHGGPVPAIGVYERRVQRSAHLSPQVRYARSLLRSLQRAAMTPWRLP